MILIGCYDYGNHLLIVEGVKDLADCAVKLSWSR
jgi:hypothetical protein